MFYIIIHLLSSSLITCKDDDEVSKGDLKMGQSILICDDLDLKTEITGKPVFLHSAALYRLPNKKDSGNVRKVCDIDVDDISVNKNNYIDIYNLGNALITYKNISYRSLRSYAPKYYKIREIDENDRKNISNKKPPVPEYEKINQVKKTLYSKAFIFDMSGVMDKVENNSEDTHYCLNYKVYNDIDKKKIEFYSEQFKYNSETKCFELVEDNVNYFTTWWAITLYVFAGLLAIAFVATACSK